MVAQLLFVRKRADRESCRRGDEFIREQGARASHADRLLQGDTIPRLTGVLLVTSLRREVIAGKG